MYFLLIIFLRMDVINTSNPRKCFKSLMVAIAAIIPGFRVVVGRLGGCFTDNYWHYHCYKATGPPFPEPVYLSIQESLRFLPTSMLVRQMRVTQKKIIKSSRTGTNVNRTAYNRAENGVKQSKKEASRTEHNVTCNNNKHVILLFLLLIVFFRFSRLTLVLL